MLWILNFVFLFICFPKCLRIAPYILLYVCNLSSKSLLYSDVRYPRYLRRRTENLKSKILYLYFIFISFLNVLLYWPSISCSGGFVYKGQVKAVPLYSPRTQTARFSKTPAVELTRLTAKRHVPWMKKGSYKPLWYFEERNSSSGMWNCVIGWEIPYDSSKRPEPFNQWHNVTP